MRKLISLEDDRTANDMAGSSRWMISYADFVTLLFVLFIVLYIAVPKQQQVKAAQQLDEKTKTALSEQAEQKQIQAELLSALQHLVDKDAVSLTTKENGLLLEIKDTALFSSGTAHLAEEADSIIEGLFDILKDRANNIVIEGHTDNIPIQTVQFPSNWELSSGRASAFLRALQEKGFPSSRLSAAGYADTRPKVENLSMEGRSKNRRVSVLILNN